MADEGFTGLENNGMMSRPKDVQEKSSPEMSRLGMSMGVFSAYGSGTDKTFVRRDKSTHEMLVNRMKAAVEVAKRMNAIRTKAVPACYDKSTEWDWAMKVSKLHLSWPKLELGDLPVRPVAIPGKTKLI